MSTPLSDTPLFFDAFRSKINGTLRSIITTHTDLESRLSKAIQYSALSGGKRIRPILTLATAQCFGVATEKALIPACAVELIHAYSLIHDDLPAMDDDDLRRGLPTCHKAFDDATAILAGDALQSMAFEALASIDHVPAKQKLNMIRVLAKSSGATGMVLGQAIDFDSVGKNITTDMLENMHRHKTGALIEASILLGAHCHESTLSELEVTSLKQYADAIGLAFQVQDDILDVVSDTQTLGKMQGADAALNKPTYPSLLGLNGARDKLQSLHETALEALAKLSGRDCTTLAQISHFIIKRSQ